MIDGWGALGQNNPSAGPHMSPACKSLPGLPGTGIAVTMETAHPAGTLRGWREMALTLCVPAFLVY